MHARARQVKLQLLDDAVNKQIAITAPELFNLNTVDFNTGWNNSDSLFSLFCWLLQHRLFVNQLKKERLIQDALFGKADNVVDCYKAI